MNHASGDRLRTAVTGGGDEARTTSATIFLFRLSSKGPDIVGLHGIAGQILDSGGNSGGISGMVIEIARRGESGCGAVRIIDDRTGDTVVQSEGIGIDG